MFPDRSPDPRNPVAGPRRETHHSVVLKLDQVDQSGSAAGWHSVVPVSSIGAGLARGYIGYSVVPVLLGRVWIRLGIIVYMDNKNNKDNRNRLDWTWVLPILWAMLIFSLIIIGS